MKAGQYRYQMNNLAWTLLTIVLVVVQMQTIIQNLFAGLIWFTLPMLLVVVNDTGAYFELVVRAPSPLRSPENRCTRRASL
jgi:phosphatidate cytidylyltransferase